MRWARRPLRSRACIATRTAARSGRDGGAAAVASAAVRSWRRAARGSDCVEWSRRHWPNRVVKRSVVRWRTFGYARDEMSLTVRSGTVSVTEPCAPRFVHLPSLCGCHHAHTDSLHRFAMHPVAAPCAWRRCCFRACRQPAVRPRRRPVAVVMLWPHRPRCSAAQCGAVLQPSRGPTRCTSALAIAVPASRALATPAHSASVIRLERRHNCALLPVAIPSCARRESSPIAMMG